MMMLPLTMAAVARPIHVSRTVSFNDVCAFLTSCMHMYMTPASNAIKRSMQELSCEIYTCWMLLLN